MEFAVSYSWMLDSEAGHMFIVIKTISFYDLFLAAALLSAMHEARWTALKEFVLFRNDDVSTKSLRNDDALLK